MQRPPLLSCVPDHWSGCTAAALAHRWRKRQRRRTARRLVPCSKHGRKRGTVMTCMLSRASFMRMAFSGFSGLARSGREESHRRGARGSAPDRLPQQHPARAIGRVDLRGTRCRSGEVLQHLDGRRAGAERLIRSRKMLVVTRRDNGWKIGWGQNTRFVDSTPDSPVCSASQ